MCQAQEATDVQRQCQAGPTSKEEMKQAAQCVKDRIRSNKKTFSRIISNLRVKTDVLKKNNLPAEDELLWIKPIFLIFTENNATIQKRLRRHAKLYGVEKTSVRAEVS